MSELQKVCDALSAIDGDIMRMAQALQAKAQSYSHAAAFTAAAARSAEGEATVALLNIAAALNFAASRCRAAAQFLVDAAGEGQSFVQRTVGGGGNASNLNSNADSMESGTPPAISPGEQVLRDNGLELVPLHLADYSENPIIDGYHKGGANRSDYRWAVETWESVIWPKVAAGATRDDFARQDEACGAPAFRCTANVYDLFLGNDRIVFSRLPDGTLSVMTGRHRIEIARELGITNLPAEIR
ncbi:MAG TPA: hypothetical protein VFQ44_03265 [Streptosporangiaceae bacterium]|nr:hypothetical protein [Streptosporangiaceae bacterium]